MVDIEEKYKKERYRVKYVECINDNFDVKIYSLMRRFPHDWLFHELLVDNEYYHTNRMQDMRFSNAIFRLYNESNNLKSEEEYPELWI